MDKILYLDNSATTLPYKEAAEILAAYSMDFFGNPSSLHECGIKAEKALKTARSDIAAVFGAKQSEIYFTSGGTESNNIALKAVAFSKGGRGRHIISTKVEHPSVYETLLYLKNFGFEISYIDTNTNGDLDIEKIKSFVRKDTVLASIMHVNNETGAVYPVYDIGKAIKSVNKNCLIHTDAVQSFCKIPMYPLLEVIDLISVSSHKVHGPKGVGALFINEKTVLSHVLGGGGQEKNIRPGTENLPGIFSFAYAATKTNSRQKDNYFYVGDIKNLLIDEATKLGIKFSILSPENSSPYILNISFENALASHLLNALSKKGIYVSTGSACSSRGNKRSRILTNSGFDNKIIDGAVRISFSHFTQKDDIMYFVDTLREILPKLDIKTIKEKINGK